MLRTEDSMGQSEVRIVGDGIGEAKVSRSWRDSEVTVQLWTISE